jgi:tRNA (guanine-N7-)-methyltransferase
MRLRNVKNATEILNNSKVLIKEPAQYKGHFQELFGNNNPIEIEIGMGKGDFILGKALKNPNINYIGIEKYASIVARAIQKIDPLDLPNLRLIDTDALKLGDVFDHEITKIYLNFSDPWPKTRHAKRRLTSDWFLPVYESISIGKPIIEQKTDNIILFASSIESFSANNYLLEEVSLDYNSEDNVETEYEKKFRAQGVKINHLIATKK